MPLSPTLGKTEIRELAQQPVCATRICSVRRGPSAGPEVVLHLHDLGDLYVESGQTLQGSFSAVSKPNFANKYSLESSRRDLHNALLCTVLQSQNFSQKSSTFFRDWIIEFPIFFNFFVEFCIFSAKFWWIFFRISRQTPEKSEVCRFSINFAKTN